MVRTLRYLLIAAAAYAGAMTASVLVNYWLDSKLPQVAFDDNAVVGLMPRSAPARDRKLETRAIFERNLFGSETGSVEDLSQPTRSISTTKLVLKGTADIEGRGFAVFVDTDTGRQDIFATGEKIFDGPELVAVFPRSAVILVNGRHQTLEIEEGEPDKPVGVSNSRSPNRAPLPIGIRKTGTDSYLVDRREIDTAIDNLNTVITQIRAVPFIQDGKSLGFRLFAIKPGSIFEKIGLHNGDVVQRVNDQALTDPAKAAGLLDAVQTLDTLKLDILRAGKPSTFSYRIQ